ncbi:hypothetical protein E4U38_001383 [Claviceps purpurea]|nr:hypothetical protein E4U38_001383 [Claviceps purpurea]
MEFQRKLKLEADNAEAPRASWVLVQLEIEVNEDGTMIAVPDHVVDPYASVSRHCELREAQIRRPGSSVEHRLSPPFPSEGNGAGRT